MVELIEEEPEKEATENQPETTEEPEMETIEKETEEKEVSEDYQEPEPAPKKIVKRNK